MAQAESMRHASALAGLGLLLLVPVAGLAGSGSESRYPYDPACPWGRLSNGKGVIHRCLSAAEAKRLHQAAKKQGEKEKGKDCAGEACATAATAATAPQGASEKAPADKKPLPRKFDVALGPIVAESGDITLGRLDAPMDRYRECVVSKGGLTGATGKVVVKFMVQADRVRAEGATVNSFEGLSKAAAQCIADVVDRRQVGAISEPLTSAQLTFTVTESK